MQQREGRRNTYVGGGGGGGDKRDRCLKAGRAESSLNIPFASGVNLVASGRRL